MKYLPVFLFALLSPLSAWALDPISDEEIAVLHWLPNTAEAALLRTHALELWLEDAEADAGDWRRQVELRMTSLSRQAARWAPLRSSPVDGSLGWLIQARDQDLSAPSSTEQLAKSLLAVFEQSSALHPLPARGRLGVEAVWAELRRRLQEAEIDNQQDQLAAFWAGQRALGAGHVERDLALAQVRRSRALQAAGAVGERLRLLAEMASAEADAAWQRGDDLQAVWSMLEAVTLLLAAPESAQADALQTLIQSVMASEEQRQREVDDALPVMLAQLQDAVEYLTVEPPLVEAATTELLDASFRLAYFAPDAAFYLDQPVRDQLNEVLTDCRINPDLIGPLPRQVFEQCPERLFGLLQEGLSSEELVGRADGPFAPEFLRRELSLLSWQRARYLDGYLNWTLQASCPAPEWTNVLEWSILVHSLSIWVPQRPVFFSSPRWQEALDEVLDSAQAWQEAHEAWLDCISGFGAQRRDPISRLLRLQAQALSELDAALQLAYQEFLLDVTRPGADVDLAADADQLTAYRPEALSVLPCSDGQTCGARVELSVSRALLGLFPNTYLLADQLGMGQVGLCYEAVRWVDREMQQARPQDPLVANFHGRLSFELVGSFDDGGGVEAIFRQRLTAAERSHYLFAEASDELLDLDCPLSLGGAPVSSRLPPERRGLVPDRLTYFVSTPVTADGHLSANWDRGAEWRDWFLTGERVEVIETPSPATMQARVQAELEALAARRERRIAGRLLGSTQADPLAAAMAAVTDNSALLRRLLEIHYPRLIRHDGAMRAAVAGSRGLLGREQVRQFRDSGQPLARLGAEGRARLLTLQDLWEALPDSLREQGQWAPETERALIQLFELRRLTRPAPAAAAGEVSPEP